MTSIKDRWEELKSGGIACEECNGQALFSENTFSYYCPDCGWILQV